MLSINYSKLIGKMAEKGKTQADMAKLINVSESTFNKILKSKTRPFSIDQCCIMCNELGITLDAIFLP
jgi:DNA-binding XRE family transcriptional regulator